jgi:ribosomal protein L40E
MIMSLVENYGGLKRVLADAMLQAKSGKGKERHADEEPFENQKICVINRWLKDSRVAGPLFQAVKKTIESSRLPGERAIDELRGAINYLAAAIILLEEQLPSKPDPEAVWGTSIAEIHSKLEKEIESRGDDISKRLNHMIYSAEKRLCVDCEFAKVPVRDMPCKKCFYLPLKPHWRPQD